MKSTVVTAFAAAVIGVIVAAPSAHAAGGIGTDVLAGKSCHVGQTYRIVLGSNARVTSNLTFTDNGNPIPIEAGDWHLGYVNWTPTTTGPHTLKLSGDITSGGQSLLDLGSSELVDLTSGTGLFRVSPYVAQVMVVNSSDTTTPCLV
ncbi:hypothetical protein JK358_10605 [Nocardia sp. 2]|uniref:Uncharacterized protein n=1 Tax=Nocardia acididurans TaxID=2802282 RepID=A0ABS1M2G0_9NOCA|nr:hypothetical protein [Nocardia acididurans]MBL1074842.1 hypothetical protein [Nocardia acididurans]